MTRLFRSAAACLATALLAAACGGDPLSPSSDFSPAAQAARAKTPTKKVGGATATDTTTLILAPTTVQSSSCGLSTDSSGTASDSTGTDDCFGDTIPWGRTGDTIPWGK
jgi:hypothetical protein